MKPLNRVLGLAAITAIAVGCSKQASNPVQNVLNNVCPSYAGTTSCCNSDGSLINPPPAGCPTNVVGTAPINSTLKSGSDYATGAEGMNNNASQLIGNNAVNPFAKTAAATAGTIAQGGQPPVGSAAATAGGYGGGGGTPAGRGGYGGGGGGGGAGMGGMGDATTADAPTGPQNGGTADSLNAAYVGGGAGQLGMNDGNKGNLAFLLGEGKAGGGLGGKSALDFAGKGNRTLASDDPDDYFSRIGKEESLFKIVEKKYRQKEMGMANSRAMELRLPASTAAPR